MVLCIYCLQLRKLTQVPVKGVFASIFTTEQARISCTFNALLSQVRAVGKDSHDRWSSGRVSACRSLHQYHQELLLPSIQV